MNELNPEIAQQLTEATSRCQEQRTGVTPSDVTVVSQADALVFTLHNALTRGEADMAKSPAGAAQVQEFHRQLFASSMHEMRDEIQRITGLQVHAASVDIETTTRAVIHTFICGAMLPEALTAPAELFPQTAESLTNSDSELNDSITRADDDGLRIPPSNLPRTHKFNPSASH